MIVDSQLLKEAKDFLKNNNVASLATISAPEAIPQTVIEAVPQSAIEPGPASAIIYYYYDGIKSVYFATRNDSAKIQNITFNNRVSLTICKAIERQEIQIKGYANIIDNPDDSIKFLISIHNAIKKDILPSQAWPLMELIPEKITIIQVTIDQFKYSHFSEKASIIEGTSDDLRLIS